MGDIYCSIINSNIRLTTELHGSTGLEDVDEMMDTAGMAFSVLIPQTFKALWLITSG